MVLYRTLFLFSGRINRRTYWLALLGSLMVIGVLQDILNNFVGDGLGLLMIPVAYWIVFALVVKRLHDIGVDGDQSKWLLLPIVGWVLTVKWGAHFGEASDNVYGSIPKASVN